MRNALLSILKCLDCGGSALKPRIRKEGLGEWREGALECPKCGRAYPVEDGIGNFLLRMSPEVAKEAEGAHQEVRIRTREGGSFLVNDESIHRFKDIFLSLPQGDGSYFFREGGSFQNFAEGAHRFYGQVDGWGLKPGMKVLEIGAGFCWASREIAKRGCELVAIDICNYLKIADLYLEQGLFFERLYADMDSLPFVDGSFDMVFAAAAVHHSSDFLKTFKELKRVLKKSGKIVLLNECFLGLLEKAQVHPEDFAFNDHYYPVSHWVSAMKRSGFGNIRVKYLSFLKDYAARKEARGAKPGLKLSLAKAIASQPVLDGLISIPLIPVRMALRPKSVLIEAEAAV